MNFLTNQMATTLSVNLLLLSLVLLNLGILVYKKLNKELSNRLILIRV